MARNDRPARLRRDLPCRSASQLMFTPPQANRLNGFALRLSAAFQLTAVAAAVPALDGAVPLGPVGLWRSVGALGVIVLYMAARHQFPAGLRTRRPLGHLTRSVFGTASMFLSFTALVYLPVATAQALAFLAPVLTLPMAAFALRERISGTVLLSVLLGLAGVVAILWDALSLPGNGAVIGVTAGLAFALALSVVRVHIKALTLTESAAGIAFYFSITATMVGLCTLPMGWVAPSAPQYGLLIGTGVLGGVGQIAMTESVARAPVSVLAPFDYTSLIWALGFDLLLFATVPGRFELLGAALITAAALIVVLRRS